MVSVILSGRVILVTALFIGIPVGLLALHFYLSFRKNSRWGLITPIIWAMLSIWIISRSETYQYEMIIFCIGIDAVLLGIWGFGRYLASVRKKP